MEETDMTEHVPNPSRKASEAKRARSKTAPRGRILVVTAGDRGIVSILANCTSRPVTVVDNFYDAIGELATTGIRSAPDAVIARVSAFGSRADEFASALRKIDPAVAILAVDDHSESTTTEITAQNVDAVLSASPSRLEFERAVQTASVIATKPQIPTPQPITTPQQELKEQPSRPPTATSIPDAGAGTEAVAPDPGPVTETDILNQIIHAPADVFATLELAILSRSGASDVQVLFDADAVHRPDATPIIHDGQLLAALISEQLADSDREHWANWIAPWLAVAERTRAWRRMAYTDDLTGARNRRYFDRTLSRTLARAGQNRDCVTILIFDVDNLKQFNDNFGHSAGDEILIETVRLLKSVIRPTDHVCRLGGDEFAVIFYDASGERKPGSKHPENITQLATRFQKEIAEHHFPKLGPDAPGRLTISGGLATFPWDALDAKSLFEHADHALLAAKRSGKNAIVVGPANE